MLGVWVPTMLMGEAVLLLALIPLISIIINAVQVPAPPHLRARADDS